MDIETNTRRSGKIARLPRDLRNRINELLYRGVTAVSLAESLNKLPEVKALLDAEFDGRPINKQNLTEWKQGGYRDWLAHQQLLNQIGDRTADAHEMAEAARDMSDSLFALLTLDYAQAMKDREKLDPREFEKKRESLSILSQDIVRLRRCHLNARRVEIQEGRFERDEEKTREQLYTTFMEWTQKPEVRKALILAPMERQRRMRQLLNLPPKPEDALVEKETQNDPDFGNSNQNQTNSGQKKKQPPKPASSEISNLKSEIQPESSSLATPKPSEGGSSFSSSSSLSPSNDGNNPPTDTERTVSLAPMTHVSVGEGWGEGAMPPSPCPSQNSKTHSRNTSPSPEGCRKLAGDNIPGHDQPTISHPEGMPENFDEPSEIPSPSSPPSRDLSHLNDYERALAEGKTFLEALYIAQSPAKNKPTLLVTQALDTFSENAAYPRHRPAPEPSPYGSVPAPDLSSNNWKVIG